MSTITNTMHVILFLNIGGGELIVLLLVFLLIPYLILRALGRKGAGLIFAILGIVLLILSQTVLRHTLLDTLGQSKQIIIEQIVLYCGLFFFIIGGIVFASGLKTKPIESRAVNSNVADEINKLHLLMKDGAISKEEFEARKKKILG